MIAIVIGHNEDSVGASNRFFKINEFYFNNELAYAIKDTCNRPDIEIVYRDTYTGLPDKVNSLGPEVAISLHCNAFNGKASGSEVLYYWKSKAGEAIAEKFQDKIVSILELPDRGSKPRQASDRGGYFLKETNCPAIILEPFFIDNNEDVRVFYRKYKEYVEGIAELIDKL